MKFSERKKLNDVEKYLKDYIVITNNRRFILFTSLPHCKEKLNNSSIKKLGLDKVSCTRCKTTLHKINLPTGCLKPKYMVIGEAPGKANTLEQTTHKTMSFGKVADMLKRCFWELGIHDQVWYTNIIKCSVNDNRKITMEEAKKCQGWLRREINFLQPKVIFVLGKNAKEMFDKYHKTEAQVIYLKHPSWFIRKGLTWKDYLRHIKSKGKE